MNNYFNLKEGEEIEIELGDSFNPKSKNFFHNVRCKLNLIYFETFYTL